MHRRNGALVMKPLPGCLLLAALLCVPAWGQVNQIPADPPDPADSSSPPTKPAALAEAPQTPVQATTDGDWKALFLPFAKTTGGFGIVLGLILGGFFVTRKLAPQCFSKRLSEKTMKVIETLSMGEKRSVALIQVGEKHFLVGNTAQQITLLAPLRAPVPVMPKPEGTAKSTGTAGTGNDQPENFRKLYEVQRGQAMRRPGRSTTIPPDVRAKMRELREALEH